MQCKAPCSVNKILIQMPKSLCDDNTAGARGGYTKAEKANFFRKEDAAVNVTGIILVVIFGVMVIALVARQFVKKKDVTDETAATEADLKDTDSAV